MIGCALFGYPFPIAGHDWREQPEMMDLCDTAKKKKNKVGGGGNRRRGANKEKLEENNTVRENSDSASHNM